MCMIFFFKQKTAYELRICDWSSDVCSSDLLCDIDGLIIPKLETRDQLFPVDHAITRAEAAQPGRRRIEIMAGIESMRGVIDAVPLCAAHPRITSAFFGAEDFAADIGGRRTKGRAEEHTSELQSLMRISYAVFCLEKKNRQS